MFLDFTQEGTYNFKNHVDNFILIKKISEFNLLLIDFSLGILDNYNKKISTKAAMNGNLTMSIIDNDYGQDAKRGKDDKDNEKHDKKNKRNEKKEKKIIDNKNKNESSRSNLMATITNQQNTFNKLNTSQTGLNTSIINNQKSLKPLPVLSENVVLPSEILFEIHQYGYRTTGNIPPSDTDT